TPVSANLLKVLTFNAGVTKNDTTLRTSFPYEQHPWRAFTGNQYVGPKSSTAATQPLSVTVVSYDCTTGNITFGRVGGDPNRVVEFAAAGVVNGGYGTSTNRKIEDELRKDANSRKILKVFGRYVGVPMSEVSFDFDFRTPCGMMGGARAAAEQVEPMLVRVIGNPTVGDDVTVEVSGATGQSVRLGITNSQGRLLNQQTIGEAGATERRTLRLGQQPGVYFIQVTTPTERRTVKIIRN
ncbi:T9SS type A sorting domain-containing protein, partial [Spirosoma utsteinense]